jgi:DNA-binding NtrC family response regulator
MTSLAHISIMDHDDAVRESLGFFLASMGLKTLGFATLTKFRNSISSASPEIALLEIRSSDIPALAMLGVIRSERPDFPLILMTSDRGYRAFENGATAGALAVLEKPFDPEELLPLLARAFERLAASATTQGLRRRV